MATLGLVLRRPHLLFRRRRPQPGNAKPSEDETSFAERTKPRLITFSELPEWCQDNRFIQTGYRPISNSYHACVHSLTYLHNETLNVYTHLLPAIILALSLPLLQVSISRIYFDAPWMDRFMLTLTPMTALGTLSLSSTYHTLMSHSHFVAASCLLLDYTGILALILSSFISGIYAGFYDSPTEQKIYWAMILTLVTISCLLVLHPRLQGPKFRSHRTAAFILTALSGFAPVIHGLIHYGVAEAFWRRGVMWWLAEGFWYGVGAYLFATRWPECKEWVEGREGRFDLAGCSHQLFHICVVLGASSHCWGVWCAWKGAVEW